jgi:hypothetical protein
VAVESGRPARRGRAARVVLICGILAAAVLGAAAQAQNGVLPGDAAQGPDVAGEGWSGFLDYRFLLHALLDMGLAAVLGAIIAYHPLTRRRMDTVEEADAPKVYVTYAVVGAVIGLMVVQYGLVVGFVVFGIGGLFRFRTTLPTARDTGRLILVTLIGLSCGLRLPHLGALATAFGFGLIFWMDRTVTYKVDVKGLDSADLEKASDAHRALIEQLGAHIIQEKRAFGKGQVGFVFRAPARFRRADLERAFAESVPEESRGTVDWEVD